MEIAGRKITPAMIVGAGMLAVAIIGFCGINPYLPGGGDNAGYIAEAEAWLSLGRRGNLYEAGAPYDAYKPPLFSLLLAAIEFFFGRNIAVMKAVLVIFATGSVWAAWWALRAALIRFENSAESASMCAACVAFWFALCPSLGLYTHDILSDVPFTFFALVAVGLAARLTESKRLNIGLALLAVLTIAIELRTAGVIVGGALSVAFGFEFLSRRREAGSKSFALMTLALLVVTLGFFAWQQRGSHTYLKEVGEALEHPAETAAGENSAPPQFSDRNLFERVKRVGSFYALFIPAEIGGYAGLWPEAAIVVLSILVWSATLAGAIFLWARGCRLMPLVWLAYHGALLIWRSIDTRFYLPLLPLFLCMAWIGMREIHIRLRERKPAAFAMIVLVAGIIPAASALGTIFFFGREEIESTTIVEWSAAIVAWSGVVCWLWMRDARRAGTSLLAALAIVFLGLASLRSISENVAREWRRSPEPATPGWPEFYRAADWLKHHADPNEIVVSAKPSLIWFWSGLRGASIPKVRELKDADAQISSANWLIVDAIAEDRAADLYLKPLLQAHPDQWEIAWGEKNTFVLHRKK